MAPRTCDGCGLPSGDTIVVSARYRFCPDCHPVCCVCRRSSGGDGETERDDWRVNGFRINNRQFICGGCRGTGRRAAPGAEPGAGPAGGTAGAAA